MSGSSSFHGTSRRRRWRRRVRSYLEQAIGLPRWVSVLGLSAGLLACETQPVRIQVKGPREAVESTKAVPEFAPFEKKNDTIQLRASAFDDKGRYMGPAKVEWDSTDRSVATVDSSGLVTILSSGEAKIKATSVGYKTTLNDELSIKASIVSDIRWVDPLPVEGKSLEMNLGDIKEFKAEVLDDRGNPIPKAKIEWDSSSFAATVTPTGEVEARAIGTTQISAEAPNGKTVRIDLNINDWKKGK